MGSPVSGLLTANNAWKLYERVAGHALQSAPVDWQPGAIAALGDCIVHPKAAHARPGPEVENLHVPGTHSGLGWNPHAIRLVADRLARR